MFDKQTHTASLSTAARTRITMAALFCIFINACSTMQVANGLPFQHAYQVSGKLQAGSRIHVYIHGDGSPWIDHTRISQYPTPRNPVTLKLLRNGPQPALYLGRPCYHGLEATSPCHPRYWTSARYSRTVVNSMRTALAGILAGYPDIQITLIGYSGGGTLATLLAAELVNVDQLVTLAANLDPDAWAARHDYTPLHESQNPALQPPLPDFIRQYHYVGELDQNVTIDMVRNFVDRQHHAELIVVPDFSHDCCWEQLWPELSVKLSR